MKRKEVWAFTFSDVCRADYWLRQTLKKFKDDVVNYNKFEMYIEFPEARYYFVRYDNIMRLRMLHPDFTCKETDLYCILDDPEFRRMIKGEEK